VYKGNRTPSYTDRIVWRAGPQLPSAVPRLYEPVDHFVTSDHKPIRGAFQVPLGENLKLPPRHRHSLHVLLQSISGAHAHALEEKKNLHFFLSDIQCDIFPSNRDEAPPDTRLTVYVNPSQLLHHRRHKWNHCCRKHDSLNDRPCTHVLTKTFNPDWKDHEIHEKLRAHKEDGSPVELGGSRLNLNVDRLNNGRKDDDIGSFSVNLEHVYRACMGTTEEKQKARDLLSKSNDKEERSIKLHMTASDNTMLSMDINGPLWKNGRQTGVIRCSLDFWWVDDSLANAAKFRALENGLATNDTHHHETVAKGGFRKRVKL